MPVPTDLRDLDDRTWGAGAVAVAALGVTTLGAIVLALGFATGWLLGLASEALK
jgi:hypothetical protein